MNDVHYEIVDRCVALAEGLVEAATAEGAKVATGGAG